MAKNNSVKSDWRELFSQDSTKFRNKKGAGKFLKMNKHDSFAKLTNKIHTSQWLGLFPPTKNELEKYNQEIEKQAKRIIGELAVDNVITTPCGIKLTTEGVNPVEFIHQYFNIIFCNKFLNKNFKELSQSEKRDDRFKMALGAYWLGFLENIDFEGAYESAYSNIHQNDVVVDVGAGYGMFALTAIKEGASKVYAIEPNENARKILFKNMELNGYTKDQILVYKNSLGIKREDKMLIYTPNGEICSGIVRHLNVDTASNNEEYYEDVVKQITFDDFFRSISKEDDNFKIDFIKINTNGREDEVIKGMSFTLGYNENLPDIVVPIISSVDAIDKIKKRVSDITPFYNFYVRLAKIHAVMVNK